MHSYHELLYTEGERLRLQTENQRRDFSGEQLFIIPKGKYHRFDLTEATRFTRLKISIADEVLRENAVGLLASGLRVASPISQLCRLLINGLCNYARDGGEGGEFYLRSSVMMLLAELNRLIAAESFADILDTNGNPTVRQIIGQISQNLSGDLSVETLAKIANTSPSCLTHNFKSEMGISLHRYIVQKRMMYARERIKSGEMPSEIAVDCGYNDYSSFYKAYIKYFGEAPTREKNK